MPSLIFRIKKMMKETVASYSLLIMHRDRIWAVRDPFGNRPLCVGKLLPTDAVTGSTCCTKNHELS